MKNKLLIFSFLILILFTINFINIQSTNAQDTCSSYKITLRLPDGLENQAWYPDYIEKTVDATNSFNNTGCNAEIFLGTSSSFYVKSTDRYYNATDLTYSAGVVGMSSYGELGRFLLVKNITSSMIITASIPNSNPIWITDYKITVNIHNTDKGTQTFYNKNRFGSSTGTNVDFGATYFLDENLKQITLQENDFSCIDENDVIIDIQEYSVGNHMLIIKQATADVVCNAYLPKKDKTFINLEVENGKIILNDENEAITPGDGTGNISSDNVNVEVLFENQPEIPVEIENDDPNNDSDDGTIVCDDGSKINYQDGILIFEEIKPNDKCVLTVEEDNIQKICFEESENLYNDLKNNKISAEKFKSKCCNLPVAESEMDNEDYEKYCLNIKCGKGVLDAKCTNEPDTGYIYQAVESGVTNNNFICLVSGVDDETNKSFEISNTIGNPYCSIYCKEDIDFKFPGFGYNERTKYAIQSGNYFVFKQFPDNLTKLNQLPSLKQKRSCIYELNIEDFTKDIYGEEFSLKNVKNLNNEPIGGLYKEAYDYLKEYFEIVNSGKTDDKLLLKYENTVEKINNALKNLNECNNYKNFYFPNDYPKIENFYYDEMKYAQGDYKKMLDEIELSENTISISNPNTMEYCSYNNSLNCKKEVINVNFPLLKINPDGFGTNWDKFIKENMIETDKTNLFEYAKNEAIVEIKYDFTKDFYALKPSGQITDNSKIPPVNKKNNSYLFLGEVLPISLVTMGGKYDYSFEITNLGKNNQLLDIYKKQFTSNKRICSYFVGNSIFCTKKGCIYFDGENCMPEKLCEELEISIISDPNLMIVSRRIDLNNLNPANKLLDSNWSGEKGISAVERIKSSGENIYFEEPMYSFLLDSKKIKEIKSYNRLNSYSDFNLQCNSEGNGCVSEFVTSYASLNDNRSSWIEYDEETKKFERK